VTKTSVFQLIDLDRTLFDTSKFVKAITDEINEIQPGLGTELDERFEAAYQKEETFFLLRYLRHEKGDLWFEALIDRIVAKYGPGAFMLPGVRERLAFASEITDVVPAWGLLTYGDKIDQLMKMRLIGLEDAPVYLTHTPNKSEVIRTWLTQDGKFTLPPVFGGGMVKMITLEDDKERAFYDLPENVMGIWVAAPGRTVDELDARGLTHVVTVQNLAGSIEVLRENFRP
jgi:hypothetical protein